MTLKELIEQTGWQNLTPTAALDISVHGVYVGDLLSWVMGHGQPEQAWITVQGHVNVIAVAVLRELSCIIVAENAEIAQDMIERAKEEKIAVLRCKMSAYEACRKLIELGL